MWEFCSVIISLPPSQKSCAITLPLPSQVCSALRGLLELEKVIPFNNALASLAMITQSVFALPFLMEGVQRLHQLAPTTFFSLRHIGFERGQPRKAAVL